MEIHLHDTLHVTIYNQGPKLHFFSGGGGVERGLRETPTWALAVVCAIFVILSILIEHAIHSLGKWFQKKRKKAMSEALEKLKAELMLLGFISLLLTVSTRFISKICLPSEYGYSMLPCKYEEDENNGDDHHRRKLLYLSEDMIWRRSLSPAAGADYCELKGKVSLISQSGLHQLHIFIFVLAVFHVLYSVVTIALGKAKMKKWKSWESETLTAEYQSTTDPERFRFTHQTSFVMRHSGLSTTPVMRWIVAFFRQFFASVTKVDYLTLRHGFINAHLSPNSNFNFHKYIKRSMEDDFKVVVGISFPLWMFAIIFLLLNVYRWHTLSYLAFAPLIILLVVGTKLQLIIMEMAQEIENRSRVVRGAPVVEPSNKLFWFNRPHWILLLIHFTMFQNAFQMAYFLWIWYEFGLRSCFHDNLEAILTRVFLGVALQILCSYITFPLYALVTQMGSHMKKSIFEEQTAKAIKKWQKAAKERMKLREAGVLGSEDGSSHCRSEITQADPESITNSQRFQLSDDISEDVLSDCEASVHQNQHESRTGQEHDHGSIEDSCTVDFTFVKL